MQTSSSPPGNALSASKRNDMMYNATEQFRMVKGQEAASKKVCVDNDSIPGWGLLVEISGD